MKLVFAFLTLFSAPAFAQLSAAPYKLNFETPIGKAVTRTATIFVNPWNADQLHLSVQENCSNQFRVSTTCFGVITFTTSCQIRVTHAPNKAGDESCRVRTTAIPGNFVDIYVRGIAL